MIKNFSKLLLCAALAMTSCSQDADDPIVSPGDQEMAKVTMTISRADASEFADAGIRDITVFVFHNERKGTTLFSESTFPVADGKFEMSFPLGESYQTVAVANASAIEGKESLETMMLKLDPLTKNDVWSTNVAKFSSDKSVSTVSLVFNRRVAAINFVPAETEAELAAVTEFDNINLTFAEVADSYMVKSGKAVSTTITVPAPASAGYKASFYTFDTTALPNGKLNITYTKGGQTVKTSKDLECTQFAAGKRVKCEVRITDPSIIDMSRSASDLINFEIADF